MSSFILPDSYSSSLDLKAQHVRKQINKRKIRKILVILITLFIIVITAQLLYYLMILPKLTLNEVKVISNTNYPIDAQVVKGIIGIDVGTEYPGIDTTRIETILMNNLMIKNVKVEKIFPDKLTIIIEEREPLVLSLFKTKKGRTLPLLFDCDGCLIKMGIGVDYFDVPILSGFVSLDELKLGSYLGDKQCRLLKKIKLISTDNRELYSLISELEIKDGGSDNLEIVLYIRGHEMPLLMKESFTQQRLLKAIGVMDALRDVGLDKGISEIDYRSNHISYLYKPGERYDD